MGGGLALVQKDLSATRQALVHTRNTGELQDQLGVLHTQLSTMHSHLSALQEANGTTSPLSSSFGSPSTASPSSDLPDWLSATQDAPPSTPPNNDAMKQLKTHLAQRQKVRGSLAVEASQLRQEVAQSQQEVQQAQQELTALTATTQGIAGGVPRQVRAGLLADRLERELVQGEKDLKAIAVRLQGSLQRRDEGEVGYLRHLHAALETRRGQHRVRLEKLRQVAQEARVVEAVIPRIESMKEMEQVHPRCRAREGRLWTFFALIDGFVVAGGTTSRGAACDAETGTHSTQATRSGADLVSVSAAATATTASTQQCQRAKC